MPKSQLHLAALALAATGVPVFPCLPGQKQPAVPGGFYTATTDPETIDRWWTAWPDANLAFSPGVVGWTVLDVDPKHKGDATLEALELCHGALETYSVRTPSGGFHHYFEGATPRNSAGRLGPGLDTRSERGYVLAPPSRTDDGAYTVFKQAPLSEIPAWIVAGLGEADRASKTGLEVEPDLPINVQGYREFMQRQPGVREGQRNDKASEYVGYAFDFGVTKDTALPIIYEWGARCDPPIPCPDEKIENHGVWLKRQNTGSPLALEGSTTSLFADAIQQAAAAGPEYERFYPYTVAELSGREQPAWLIEDIIRERGVGYLYGETGSYKSYLAATLAYDTGLPAVYAIGEGEEMFAKRVEALQLLRQREHGLRIVTSVPLIAEPGDVLDFIQAMKRHKVNPQLVVLDTLAVAIESLDESTSKDMGRFVAAMKLIRTELGTAVLAIHHKSDKAQAKGERGSSALKGNVDFAGLVVGDAASKVVKLSMTKQRGTELRTLPFVWRGVAVPVGLPKPELAFSPIDLAEYDRVTKAELGATDVARKMTAKSLWGKENGITTSVLASIVREPVEGERPEDVEKALTTLARSLNDRARRDLAGLAYGDGAERRWWLEPKPSGE